MGLLLPLFFSSCLKESVDDMTIVLFGEEGYVKDFEEVFGMTPDVGVFEVDSAIKPPDVRGEYEFADRQLFYPAGAFEDPNDKVYFRFGDGTHGTDYLHGQHHLIVHCDIKIPGLSLNSAIFRTDTAYVMGSGSHFTVYLERTQEVEPTPLNGKLVRFELSQGIAINGTRESADSDIKDARLAFYNKDIRILNADEFLPEELEPIYDMKGRLYVYKDSDGVTVFNTGAYPYINWNE